MLRLTCTVLLACLTFILVYTDNMHIAQVMHSQREGMGLLEYQAMPSLRVVTHDGVMCTFSNRSTLQTRASGVVRQGRRHRPSITFEITSCWVTLLQPARRAAVLGHPSSLRPHYAQHMLEKFLSSSISNSTYSKASGCRHVSLAGKSSI